MNSKKQKLNLHFHICSADKWLNSSASEIPQKPSTFLTSLLVLLRDAFLTLICFLFHLVSKGKSFCNFLIYLQVTPFTEVSKCYGGYWPTEGQMCLRYIHSSNSMETSQTSYSSQAKTSSLPSMENCNDSQIFNTIWHQTLYIRT